MKSESLTFSQLTTDTLYTVMQLRIAVFVVEQTCYYQDADGLDKHPETRHFMMWKDGELAGYARLLAPGTSYSGCASIGRILNPMPFRGKGLGQQLVAEAVSNCTALWPEHPIKISAQAHLQGFYEKHDFEVASEQYLEDGIPHIAMIRKSHLGQ